MNINTTAPSSMMQKNEATRNDSALQKDGGTFSNNSTVDKVAKIAFGAFALSLISPLFLPLAIGAVVLLYSPIPLAIGIICLAYSSSSNRSCQGRSVGCSIFRSRPVNNGYTPQPPVGNYPFGRMQSGNPSNPRNPGLNPGPSEVVGGGRSFGGAGGTPFLRPSSSEDSINSKVNFGPSADVGSRRR